jgi:hypothetical protein
MNHIFFFIPDAGTDIQAFKRGRTYAALSGKESMTEKFKFPEMGKPVIGYALFRML